ncbi:diguanylate cyclase [uncultured Albimonas sp.]|uniref:diguanylate cyclase n=1 Tax=uncultured Albimonas sp. TaxID=1331701 RepID=UPI0030EB46CC
MPGRILIAGGPSVDAHRLADRLADAFLAVHAAPDGRDALDHALASEPDLVIADVRAGGISGLALCRALKAHAALLHVPLLIAGVDVAPRDRLATLEAGADDFLSLPIADAPLLARLRNLLRVKAMIDELRARDRTARSLGLVAWTPASGPLAPDLVEPPGDLLLVRSDAGARRRAAQLSTALGLSVRRAADGREALELVDDAPPELVLIEPDPEAPGAVEAALRLVAALRARPAARDAGVLAALPEGSAATALDLGASDCVAASTDLAELGARLRTQLRRKRCSDRLRDAVRQGLELAVTDPLTGLFNRRYAETHLAAMVAQCAAARQPLSLMLLDLDRFKQINDCHGHPAGDAVLRGFAARLRAAVRGVDLVARIGGEEFCVALPGADEAEARGVAERVRAAVAAAPFPAPEGGDVAVTVSIGVAVAEPRALCAHAASRIETTEAPAPPGRSRAPTSLVAGMAEPPAAFARGAPAPAPSARAPSARALTAAVAAAAPSVEERPGEAGSSKLMALADAALYRSKSQGRDRVSFAPS